MICGEENLDFVAMQKGTDYEGFTEHSTIIKFLWEILHEMTIEEKKAFLFFVTGSDRAPIKGLGELGLLIQRQSPDTDNLPTAHTCTNVFLLP
jgi:ubiquitin-protein ligase E3 A